MIPNLLPLKYIDFNILIIEIEIEIEKKKLI